MNYLNYNCYSKLNYYFSKNRISESGENCLKKGKQVLNNQGKYYNEYDKIFQSLAGAFSEMHAFYEIGPIPSCKLINYILNAKFGSTYKHVDKNKFEIFKEFSDIYFEECRSKSSSCKPYMNFLEDDELNKMKKLYTLYNEYEKFTTDTKYNKNTLCSYLYILRLYYNDLLKEYDGKKIKDELMDKIIEFKEVLRKKVKETDETCLDKIEYFQPPTKYLENKQKAEQERLLAEKAAKEAEQERARAEKAAKEAEQERARVEKAAEEGEEEPQELQFQQIPEDELPGRIFIQPPYADTKLPERFRSVEMQTNHIDSQLYKPEDTRVTPPSDEGIIHSLKGTFNSIVEIVEPAPILGVSGGMGVLFIILKYTPVGTMFRGRGNRRRIPGSFGGEYPGFMPSFQGHEYGYFPYDQINIAYGPE
ncbi:Plasmodium vivax Vir protein, putative [Plasmodium vivax]|uniref:Vir protein, putative n=1 Tax=Plasmodium vivax TaxID=5855 RepID=A0A1G4E8G6_PLAVI|nr:Plasmodium vivax Vir protein, putative [Plasmodium vivax]